VPPRGGGGDGDDWLGVRPRRRKARRQWDRGQDRQFEDKRLRNWKDAGKRQSRFRDSRDGFYGSDTNYYQDRGLTCIMRNQRRIGIEMRT